MGETIREPGELCLYIQHASLEAFEWAQHQAHNNSCTRPQCDRTRSEEQLERQLAWIGNRLLSAAEQIAGHLRVDVYSLQDLAQHHDPDAGAQAPPTRPEEP